MNGMLNVHVRVNDAASGQPTPVRLAISDAAGRFYPPLGRMHDFPVGRGEAVGGAVYAAQQRFTYSSGSCEVPLPAGIPLTVTVSKGPAYRPVTETVVLGAGQLALRLAIQPNKAALCTQTEGRCHFLTPHAAQLEAAAEGIDLTNLLACVNDYPSTDGHMYRLLANLDAFSGQQPALPGVYVNTFNTHPVLGHLALLNCHRVVYPLTFGGDDPDDWSLADWCQQCHRKKGLAIWCDAYRDETGFAGEGVIDALLGKVDALEVTPHERKTPFLPLYYRLLNAGVRLPLVGSSAKTSNRDFLGSMRTLTPGPNTTYSDWIEHVRAGRTVATNGPLLDWRVQDVPYPAMCAVAEPSSVRLCATANSVVPYERLELLVNGEVIAQTTGETLEIEYPVTTTCWVAARCWGAKPSSLYPGQPVFAHSSPTWLQVGDQPFARVPSALAALRRDIERVREWVTTTGNFQNPKRREQLLVLIADAQQRLV